MANLEDEGTSSEPTDELWNIAITSKSEGSDCVPQKSSNEILTELFGAFNAEPPKCALASDNDNDELKGRKHRKKHKKERKHKKKNRNRRRLSDEQDNSSVGYSSESENELEKRKERKHKSKRKHRSKASDIDSGEETKPTKRGRHSQSPSETQIGSTDIVLKDVKVEVPCVSEGRTEKEINGEGNVKTDTVSSSTPASCLTPPLHPISKKDDVVEASVFENVKLPENSDEKIDKAKPTMGKIIIKDLKFSTVYEATVKEVEEQAKAKAEKYEEGEISDNSSPKTSDSSDDPAIETNLDPVPDTVELIDSSGNAEEGAKVSKRPHSEEKSSSHHKKSKHKSRSRSRSRSDHKTKDKDKERHGKHKDRDRDKDKHKEKEKDKHREKGRDRSRDRSRDREKDRERERQRDRDRKDKDHRDRRRGRSRSRSRSRGIRNRSSSRSRRRHSRDRRRTRSRSKDRRRSSGSDHIDKKKLLEIARRNAMNMIQAGILPGTIGKAPPTEAAPVNKSEKTAKTVDELTEYCKELSKRENMGELSSLSGSEDSDSEKPFHHPFQVKDRPSFISLNIKNAVQLPLKTLQEQKVEQSQLRIQFPVSSGQQHRKTESEWVPVVPSKKTEEKKSTGLKAIEAPKRATSTPSSSEVVDIGALVSQRLSALRKKHDSEQIQPVDYMHGWNSALPGQFTGDTGVRLLTPQQLASGAQAWARKVSDTEAIIVT